MKKFLLTLSLLALCLGANTAWADEVTLDFSTSSGLKALGLGVPSNKAYSVYLGTGTYTQDGVSLSATNGSSSTRVFYTKSGISLRVYKGGSITLSVAEGNAITSVKFKLFEISYYGCFTADSGSFDTTTNWSTKTTPVWTGSANSVKFSTSQSPSSKYNPTVAVSSIVVTYTSSGTSSKTATSLSFANSSYSFEQGSDEAVSFNGQAASLTDASGNAIADATLTYASSNTGLATVDANDGTVTLVENATGATTITATYPGNDTYEGSTASYTITVTEAESTTTAATSEVTFDATADFPSAGTGYYKDGMDFSITKSGVTLNVTGSNTSDYGRVTGEYYAVYKDKTITFTAPEGLSISSVTLTTSGSSDKNAKGFTGDGYTASSTTRGKWSGLSRSVSLTAEEHLVYISKIVVTLVAVYERTATSSGWGTICLLYAAKTSGSTAIYTVDGLTSDGYIQVSEVESGVMTAGMPYIYKSKGKAVFLRTDLESTELTNGLAGANNLQGVLSDDAATRSDLSDAYIMNGGIWYRVGEGDFTFTAYHAYLTALPSAVASVKANSVAMDIDGVSAIAAVSGERPRGAEAIYTLGGQRVSSMVRGNLYIVNGKKILAK